MGALTIKDFREQFGIGRTSTYKLLATGDLKARKVGRRTLIERASAERWFASLPGFQRMERTDG
jgi:excisionase family DNA binding protein